MKEIISFVQNNPWVVVAVMSVIFYVSLARLLYKRIRRHRAFKMLKSMENDGEVSKVYLRVDNGYGDFYDIVVSDDGETWYRALLSDAVLTPSFSVPPGEYLVRFSIKSRSGISAYHSKKGVFQTVVVVEPSTDTTLVFDNETLNSWQENYKEN